MKRYKLKKDLPGSKIGDVWVKADNGFMSPEGRDSIIMHEHLFNPFNEWFEDYEDDDLSKIIKWLNEGLVEKALPISVNDFVEKLEAWQRLQDKGYKFGGRYFEYIKQEWLIKLKPETYEEFVIGQTKQDLDLLFGGEDE